LKSYCPLDETTKELLKFAMVDLNLSARAYDWVLKVVRTIAIWPPPTKTPATTFPRRFNTDHWTGSYQREDESLDRAGAYTTLAFQEKMSISYALILLCVELSSARENHVFIIKSFLFVFLIVVVFVIVIVIVSFPLAFGSSPLEEGCLTFGRHNDLPRTIHVGCSRSAGSHLSAHRSFAILAVQSQNCARFQVVSGV